MNLAPKLVVLERAVERVNDRSLEGLLRHAVDELHRVSHALVQRALDHSSHPAHRITIALHMVSDSRECVLVSALVPRTFRATAGLVASRSALACEPAPSAER